MAKASQRVRIGRALLALCGPRQAEAAALSEHDWKTLDALAEEHRLRPMLHGRVARGEIAGIPGNLAERWKAAHRQNGITMLAQRRALAQVAECLGAGGITPVALKGSALAWSVWPAPAERVMRDIDVLVPQAGAARAYDLLKEAGWSAPALDEAARAQFAFRETHFPPLTSPDGVECELHARLWGRAPLPGMAMPSSDASGVVTRAVRSPDLDLPIPSPEDMLAHLVGHAVSSHLLNVGPMALVDIDLWCASQPVDWQMFHEHAQRDGIARPAALVLALTDRWRGSAWTLRAGLGVEVDEALLGESELLLVQDLDARKDVSALASLGGGKIAGRTAQHPLDRAEGKAGAFERGMQLAARALSLGRSAVSGETRRAARATARLRNWLET